MTGSCDLVLWDIDLTLIETGGLGGEIYRTIFPQVTGVPLAELPPMHGRTELHIAREALQRHDLPAGPDDVGRLLAALGAEFRRRSADLRARASLLPGVPATLALLDRRGDAVQSLVTGNIREVARLKLEAAGIADRFRWCCGAFGDEHADRSRLVRLARQRADDAGVPVRRVLVIGDTPDDVAAALTGGGRAIGVATGRFSAADLRAAGAHVVLDDLSAAEEVRAALDAA